MAGDEGCDWVTLWWWGGNWGSDGGGHGGGDGRGDGGADGEGDGGGDGGGAGARIFKKLSIILLPCSLPLNSC